MYVWVGEGRMMVYAVSWQADPHYPWGWSWPVTPAVDPRSGLLRVSPKISKAEEHLNQEFRTLWEQHVAWTRMLIISIAEGLRDEKLVTDRLLRNPDDMAAVLNRYYGNAAAGRFRNLMRDHLVLAAQLVTEAKAGNAKAVADTEKKWYANADEIAAFQHSINPHWSEAVIRNMMHEHLRLTKAEAVQRLSKKYQSDISTFDRIERQALGMADDYTRGIVRQFPGHFA
jgi:hypothetical protein